MNKETDVIGVSPEDLGSFTVRIFKFSLEKRTLSNWEIDESKRKLVNPNEYRQQSSLKSLWDAQKVDKASFVKHGISQSIG